MKLPGFYTTYSPNFSAMKKSQFNGVDYIVVEQLKPPIEKFNVNEDLQSWAKKKSDNIVSSDLGGRNKDTYFQRREELRHWNNELKYDEKSDTERLLVLNGIAKQLDFNDDTYVPSYDKIVLNKSLNQIKSLNSTNFNFYEIYRKNLIKSKLEDTDNPKEIWVHIPSKMEDKENYKNNIEKLQVLSSQHWCTKAEHAKDFLRDYDFDIYLENYEPKIAIKSEEGYIVELEDELNKRKIPMKYRAIVNKYISQQDMEVSEIAQRALAN